jgi:hypothetical protein
MLSLNELKSPKFPARALAASVLAVSLAAAFGVARADDSALPKLADKKPLRDG